MQSDIAVPNPERVEEIFQLALDAEPSAREELLRRECGGDEALRKTVEALLEADRQSTNNAIWDKPALWSEATRTAVRENTTLDRYRLVHQIGAGGMGVVYKAIRDDDEFSKTVAIKILPPGIVDAATLQRLRTERQILAALEHPNIARLLDGGTTNDGRPFLVMEYVDGVPVDKYLNQHQLKVVEVLNLFRKICSAVAAAHRNLVVHRDLKPANILVRAGGEPTLLDFGIAKLLDRDDRTRTGEGALTPDYASPEQIRGEPITTASDIYSLGVLLYQMLTGCRPYRPTTGTFDLAQAICVDDPRPMNAATSKHIDSDLETIVQMALRKEPARRYQSVDQLSDDVRRHLDGYPVMARRDSRTYRFRKFIGRNQALVAAASIAVIALIAGLLIAANQARIANRRFNDVRKLANSYLFEFHDAIKDLPGSTPARQLVVKRALEYLDSLAAERSSEAGLNRELAEAYAKVADVEGRPDFPNLGDRKGALRDYRKALALIDAQTGDKRSGLLASELYEKIARILVLDGNIKESSANARHAVETLESIAKTMPEGSAVQGALASAWSTLASLLGNPNYPNIGDTKGAMDAYRKALAIDEARLASHPSDAAILSNLSTRYFDIGEMRRALNDGKAAAEAFQHAVSLSEELLKRQPLNTAYQRNAASQNRSLAMTFVQQLNNRAAARPYIDRAAQLFEQLAKEDPTNQEAQSNLADSYYSQGFVIGRGPNAAEALRYYDRAIEVFDRAVTEHPGPPPLGLRTTYQLRADSLTDLGEYAKAIESANRELAIDDQLLKIDPRNAGAERNQALAYTQIAFVHQKKAESATAALPRAAEWKEVSLWSQRAIDILSKQQREGRLIPMYLTILDRARKSQEKAASH